MKRVYKDESAMLRLEEHSKHLRIHGNKEARMIRRTHCCTNPVGPYTYYIYDDMKFGKLELKNLLMGIKAVSI